MADLLGHKELKALQQLFSSANDSESEDDLPQAGARKIGPSNIGTKKETTDEDKEYKGPHAKIKGEGDDIWHVSEIQNSKELYLNDPREVPQYDMKFKQAVSPEDIYLGLGFKTPGSASCEWLSINIKMPNEVREKIELSVKKDSIDVRSLKYRLHLPTPHPIDPRSSSAKWNSDTSTLELTLKLSRELDEINF